MNLRTIIAQIDQSKKEMERQLIRLQAFTPTVIHDLSGQCTVGEIMNAAVSAQLHDAVNAVTVMSSMDAGGMQPREAGQKGNAHDEQVIDAEFKEVKK